jgi:hypothetical protein
MTKSRRAGGNYVSEWFGQRIYPAVRLDTSQITGTHSGRCPFLSEALHAPARCTKPANSSGVCTISSLSNGSRQDWLVCPHRVINSSILSRSCQRIFGLDHEVIPVASVRLEEEGELERFANSVVANRVGYLFFHAKLGGEVSVSGTSKSPELSFDITIVEIKPDEAGGFVVSRYGILELQTMDYHGTYVHAVNNLRDGLRLHPTTFPQALEANLDHWSGEGIEGPNIANVFKRTFYQMLLKFRLAGDGSAAAGTVLALPRSVWDSWQPFLGAPELEDEDASTKRLRVTGPEEPLLNAFICVFDLEADSPTSVSPVTVNYFVRVSPERLTHHAFTEVPATILHALQTEQNVLSRIKLRLGEVWPAFREKGMKVKRKVKKEQQ